MAPLAAKWGRLWRALLGQARSGARPARRPFPKRPPRAGESPALLPSGLRQEWSPEGAGPRARCVPLGPPRVLPLRGAPPGRLTRRPDTCSPLATRLAPVRKRGQGETEAGSQRRECGSRPGRGTKEPRAQTRAPSARPRLGLRARHHAAALNGTRVF